MRPLRVVAGGWYHGVLRFPSEYPMKVRVCVAYPLCANHAVCYPAACGADADTVWTLRSEQENLYEHVRLPSRNMEPNVVCVYDTCWAAVLHGAYLALVANRCALRGTQLRPVSFVHCSLKTRKLWAAWKPLWLTSARMLLPVCGCVPACCALVACALDGVQTCTDADQLPRRNVLLIVSRAC